MSARLSGGSAQAFPAGAPIRCHAWACARSVLSSQCCLGFVFRASTCCTEQGAEQGTEQGWSAPRCVFNVLRVSRGFAVPYACALQGPTATFSCHVGRPLGGREGSPQSRCQADEGGTSLLQAGRGTRPPGRLSEQEGQDVRSSPLAPPASVSQQPTRSACLGAPCSRRAGPARAAALP